MLDLYQARLQALDFSGLALYRARLRAVHFPGLALRQMALANLLRVLLATLAHDEQRL